MALIPRSVLFQKGVNVALTRGALRPPSERLTREAIERPGTDANIANAAASFMGDEVQAAASQRLAALYLDSAEGADLDRLVADRFSPTVVRKEASASVVTLEFTRPDDSAGPVSFDIGDKIRTADGVEFELTQAVSLGAVPPASLKATGPAQAVQTGTQGNVGPGTLVEFVQPPPDPTITVTNPDIASGGADTESDASLRFRARDFFRTARRGTLSAIEFGSLVVLGVEQATAIELLGSNGLPNGYVQDYIADSNGQSNAILAQAVEDSLVEYRAAGVWVDVLTTTPFYQTIVYKLQYVAGIDTQAAFTIIQQRTIAAVNSLRPRQILERSLLFEVARSVPGVIVPDDAVQEPSGDVVPTGNQTIRTSTSRVSQL